jgi:hypothetical protein
MVKFNYKWFGFFIFSGGIDRELYIDDTKINDKDAFLNKINYYYFSLEKIHESWRIFTFKTTLHGLLFKRIKFNGFH